MHTLSSITIVEAKMKLSACTDSYPLLVVMSPKRQIVVQRGYVLPLMRWFYDQESTQNGIKQNHSFSLTADPYYLDTRVDCSCPVIGKCSIYEVKLQGCLLYIMRCSSYHVCQEDTLAPPPR